MELRTRSVALLQYPVVVGRSRDDSEPGRFGDGDGAGALVIGAEENAMEMTDG